MQDGRDAGLSEAYPVLHPASFTLAGILLGLTVYTYQPSAASSR